MLDIRVLGSIRVHDSTGEVTPSGGLQRRLLASLVLAAGAPRSADRLADELWGDELPANHVAALQTQIFRLRKRLPELDIERVHGGYVADLSPHRVDVVEFERRVTEAFAAAGDDPTQACSVIEAALDLWAGEAFAELDGDDAIARRAHLDGLRARAVDERTELLLAAGGGAGLVAELEARAVLHPTRERVHAQLVRALAASGRAVDALRAYDRFRVALGDELGLEPSPELRAVHDSIVLGEASTSAFRPIAAPLPRFPTSLVGRDNLVEEVARCVTESRLVTLTGVGGVGKTRVAAAAADLAGAHFDGSVVWCDLAPSSSATLVETVASQLGVESRLGDDLVGRIVRALVHGTTLVVLDNCEHVVEHAADLATRLVRETGGVHVLATSRERLAVDGERVVPVEPLIDVGAGAAATLFVERAAAVAAHVDVDERVEQLCRRLGGIPLAIELAAAQLHTLDLDTVASAIEHGLDVLSGQRRSDDRHRSLAAAIEWSFDLLAPDERRAFVRLGAFRAPFTTEVAAELLGSGPGEVLPVLRGLAERSLLRRRDGRWQMLEPLRQFASERCEEAGDRDAVLRRHALLFVDRAEALNAALRTPAAGAAMLDIDADLPDLRAVHARFVAFGDAELLFRLACALKDYGASRPRSEVLRWSADAAELAPSDPRSADMLAFVAYAAWSEADRDRLGRMVRRALERCERLGIEPTLTVCDSVGLNALITGALADAAEWYSRALAMVDRSDVLRHAESAVTHLLAVAYAGDPATAELAERVLADFDGCASPIAEAWALYGAGEALVDLAPDVAIARLQRAVEQGRRSEAWFIAGAAAASLASLEVRVGDPARAVELYRWLLPMWVRGGDVSVVWTAMRAVAVLLCRLGDPRTSATLLHAVRTTPEGHGVFGIDVERLAVLETQLRVALDDAAFEAAAREGAGLDAASAIELVLDRLDVLSPTG